VIEYRDVSVVRGGNAILDRVSLRIDRGERVAFLGRSGAGKTTALKVINGLLAPSAGEILVDGAPMAHHELPQLRRRIGYVMQQPALFPHRTVFDNVATVPRLLEWPEEKIRAEAERLLVQLELPLAEFGARFPRMLSGGQQQRVAIARALIAAPEIVLCDEPFSALDPIIRAEMQSLFDGVVGGAAGAPPPPPRRPPPPPGPGAPPHHSNDARLRHARRARSAAHRRARDRVRRRTRRRRHARGRIHESSASTRETIRRSMSDLVRLTGEHLLIVTIAVAIAIAAGVPLGTFAHRRRRLGGIALRVTDVVQTIPSLAMFGFLIPLPLLGGIGPRPAIVALVLYSLLPIVRSTLVGLERVDAHVREAATAMGMTDRQLLWNIELPLATPAIVAGIRIATVTAIGVATIAAAIGGGGLGTLIFRGVSMVDTKLILQGAVPAALLAIAADAILTQVEHYFAKRRGES
jgi:ABC-type proline/glycine betaine transport system permease subunit/ABC-type nitrate/sulfonate/bicarbonate transport system ATPase subunit